MPLSDDCLPVARLIAHKLPADAIMAMRISFFIANSSNVRQAQNLPRRASEDGEWCDYHKFHVTLILEDVAVTTAPAWDVGVVVVFGEMQFEHRAFGATVLNGIDRIQAVGRLFNSPVFVVVRIRIALPGRRFSIPCVNVGSADGEAGRFQFSGHTSHRRRPLFRRWR